MIATISPTIFIEGESFPNAYARAVKSVRRIGHKMVIGDATHPKPIRDVCALFVLTGNAIQEIESRELHPQFPFQHIDPYCEEFTRKYLSEYIEKPDKEKFSYTYLERLMMYGNIDQVALLKDQLAGQIRSGVSSNRDQAIIWQPEIDLGNRASPCLQRIWIRYLGNRDVEVHLTWRSRDLYTAWQVNIIAIIDMLNREVISPNNCRIVKLVDYIDSLHVYDSDKDADKVNLVPVNPQFASRRTIL